MNVPDTVTEAVAVLEADGYTGEFQARGNELVCGVCGAPHSITGAGSSNASIASRDRATRPTRPS